MFFQYPSYSFVPYFPLVSFLSQCLVTLLPTTSPALLSSFSPPPSYTFPPFYLPLLFVSLTSLSFLPLTQHFTLTISPLTPPIPPQQQITRKAVAMTVMWQNSVRERLCYKFITYTNYYTWELISVSYYAELLRKVRSPEQNGRKYTTLGLDDPVGRRGRQ